MTLSRERTSAPKQRMSPLAKAVVALSIGLAIAADILFPGWGRSVLVTVVVFGGMIAFWPRFWHRWWFWASVLPPLAIQIALLYTHASVRASLERVNPFLLFSLLLLEILLLSLVLGIAVWAAGVPAEDVDAQ